VRVGVTLPVFRHDPRIALDVARRAEAAGLDGVFCFDHLWPARQPDRPALSALPMLGALVSSTTTVKVGSLVARVGLLPDALLVASLACVHALAGGRLIAGIGTGDRLSEAENVAYGVPYPEAGERRASLLRCVGALGDLGVPTWISTSSVDTRASARERGAVVNLWGADREVLEKERALGEVTWAGSLGAYRPEMTERVEEVAAAGASWAVGVWPVDLVTLGEIRAEMADRQAPEQ
jgi:alkanesulfonate monooxygenase SsuD/methylene tetrahydromethanopterin reductase-like flavin-dependent oxidoreductase (luciferase family)